MTSFFPWERIRTGQGNISKPGVDVYHSLSSSDYVTIRFFQWASAIFMKEKLTGYDAIIFDMDGTLIDSMPTHLEAWRLTSEKYGFPFDREWHHSLGGMSTERTAERVNQRYNLSLDSAAVAQSKRLQWEAIYDGPVLIDETYGVFVECEGNKKLAVGTGAIRDHAEDLLAGVGLLDRLDALVTVTDVENGKPHPDTFLQAASLVGVNPGRCLVFEDTELGRHKTGVKNRGQVFLLKNRGQVFLLDAT
ncbi:HAD-IA family hydrolase [Endozoicomonas sp.]|uniref:HAD-IA family hydrolase n=1 Tax=Endozoicomonas sp. TaxID=1892382 RepID=UPI00383B3949